MPMMIPNTFQFQNNFFNQKPVETQLKELGFAIWKKDQHQLDVIPPMGWTVVDEESSKNFYNMDMVLKVSLKSGKLYLW